MRHAATGPGYTTLLHCKNSHNLKLQAYARAAVPLQAALSGSEIRSPSAWAAPACAA